MSDISIKIKGQEWRGWEQVSVVRSVDAISGAFVLKFADVFKGGLKPNFNFGDPVVITSNGFVLITGYLDDIEYEYNDERNALVLSGRDTTGALVDCSFVGTATEWKNQSVSSIVAALCSPFNIGVAIDDSASTNAAQRVASFKATEGEFVFEIIARLCRDHALSPLSLGDGRLTLTQATTSRKMKDGITLPGNCKQGRFTGSNTDRFSLYLVKGVGNGTAQKNLTDFIQPVGESTDDIITVTKPRVIFADTATDSGLCQARADWECRYNAGVSRMFHYTMADWGQSEKNRSPWDIHSLVQVQDKAMNLTAELYIREIEYTRNGDDETCLLSCVFPFAYSTAGKILKTEFDA